MLLQSRTKSLSLSPEKGPQFVKTARKISHLVAPATPTDPHWLQLANLDRVVNPTFISVIFFYKDVLSEAHSSFRAVTASLKDSLSKVLVDFYPLAGRLAVRDQATGLVDLHCNDAGAIFLEASADVELGELGGPQPMPMLSGMDAVQSYESSSGKVYIPDQLTPIPVLVIQITQFTCGSIAVAVNWHHTVADALSGSHFIRSWAERSTGLELSLRPCHNRRLLEPRIPLSPSNVNGYSTRTSVESVQERSTSRTLQHPEQNSHTTVVQQFLLSKEWVEREKETVYRIGNQGRFTTAETMSAQLWKLMTKARSEDEDDLEEVSRFFTFVEGRKRLGLPPGYFGNVVCSSCVVSTKREILTNPLTYAACLIRAATRAISKEDFRALIDWVEVQKVISGSNSYANCISSDHNQSTGNDVVATFWNFFPLYKINFGWGKPVRSMRNAPPRKLIDGISILPAPANSDDLLVLLNLPADRMLRLQQDPEFITAYSPLLPMTR